MKRMICLAIFLFPLSIVSIFSIASAQPAYSLNGTNGTVAGTAVKHSVNWTDNVALNSTGGYTFSFDNGTGLRVEY